MLNPPGFFAPNLQVHAVVIYLWSNSVIAHVCVTENLDSYWHVLLTGSRTFKEVGLSRRSGITRNVLSSIVPFWYPAKVINTLLARTYAPDCFFV